MSNPDSGTTFTGSLFTYLGRLFRAHGVEAILVGGYALNANNVQRTTFDIDFMMTAEDFSRLEPAVLKTGYSIFNRQDSFIQFKSERHGLRDLDILISDKHTVQTMIKTGKNVTIAGEVFVAPSPEHLIAMKVHSIAGNSARLLKDLPDIVLLMKANGINPGSTVIKDIFIRSNALELHRTVMDSFGDDTHG